MTSDNGISSHSNSVSRIKYFLKALSFQHPTTASSEMRRLSKCTESTALGLPTFNISVHSLGKQKTLFSILEYFNLTRISSPTCVSLLSNAAVLCYQAQKFDITSFFIIKRSIDVWKLVYRTF